MFSKLLLIFIAIPLIELALLVKIGEIIGFWPTIGLVIVTGVIGASLAKAQGFLIFNKIQGELRAGRLPASEMIDGLLILIGGIVLLTPGLLTDLTGFALMIPPVRAVLKKWLRKKFGHMIETGRSQFFYSGFGNQPPEFRDDYRIEE